MSQIPDAKKKFKMFDAVLASVCIVMTIEASASAAQMGNQQYFWWIFLILAFFLPYGLITAELGTTYQGEGGLYEWVCRAYGGRTGSRTAAYYWFNYPIWVSSIVLLITNMLRGAFGLNFSTIGAVAVQLVIIWAVAGMSLLRLSESKWILNAAAVCKAIIMVAMGGLGLYTALTQGVANEFTLQSFVPTFDSQGLSYLSVIVFNLMGFEVITTYTGEMSQPEKQLPRAIKLGGFLIVGFYMLAAFGLSVAIPVDQVNTSLGVINTFQTFLQKTGGPVITLVSLMFLYSLVANLLSWCVGVNYVVKSAAQEGNLPKILAAENKNGMPIGSAIINGMIASVIVIIEPLIPNQDLFWQFFALNMVVFLLSYVMIFPAFLKLRKIDGERPRPFRVKGGNFKLKLLALCPMVLIVLSVVFTCIPLNGSWTEWQEKLPILAGTIFVLGISEWIAHHCAAKKRKQTKAEGLL